MRQLTLEQFINRIPKADIHYHLLGGVRLETMVDLAEKYQHPLSLNEAKSYYRAYQHQTGSSKGGIAALSLLYQLMQQPEDYYRVLLEVAEDAQACGVKYIETFWNPSDTDLTYEVVNQALVAGIEAAFEQWGIVIRLIPSINREKSPEVALAMVEAMIRSPHPYVLGIGIDYKEHHAPVEHFWKAYQLAQKHGYKLTAHCSEFGLHWRNVESAIELLQVDRIDHGYSIIDNAQLTQKYAALAIPFTVVPSNTYFLNQWPNYQEWCANHPIITMAKAGLTIVPCTDDWHIHNTNTTNCYRTMVEDFGFDVLSLKTFMINSVKASWMDEEQKNLCIQSWSEAFDDAYQQLDEQILLDQAHHIHYRSPLV
ncbi:adenosine deaminase family protein [Vibrio aphrogenes]|uniref:adenosine deaminase family protein n=1 Tax=Vibrio aphrogenes TaxID=1891186 RepID=UPI000B36155B|nr:adenosine deaminase [Vibrio aphrogenes]